MPPTHDEEAIIDAAVADRDARQVGDWRRVDELDDDLALFDDEVLVQWQDSNDRIAVYVSRGEHTVGSKEGEDYYEAGTGTVGGFLGYSSKSLASKEETLRTALDEAIDYLERTDPDTRMPTFSMRMDGGLLKPPMEFVHRLGGGKALFTVREDGIRVQSAAYNTGVDFFLPATEMDRYDVDRTGGFAISSDDLWQPFKEFNFSDVIPLSLDGEDERPQLGIGPVSRRINVAADYIDREFTDPRPADVEFTADGLTFEDAANVAAKGDFETGAIGVQDGTALLYSEAEDGVEAFTANLSATNVMGEGLVSVDIGPLVEFKRAQPRFSQNDPTFVIKFDAPMLVETAVGDSDIDLHIFLSDEAVPLDIRIPPEEITVPEDATAESPRKTVDIVIKETRTLGAQVSTDPGVSRAKVGPIYRAVHDEFTEEELEEAARPGASAPKIGEATIKGLDVLDIDLSEGIELIRGEEPEADDTDDDGPIDVPDPDEDKEQVSSGDIRLFAINRTRGFAPEGDVRISFEKEPTSDAAKREIIGRVRDTFWDASQGEPPEMQVLAAELGREAPFATASVRGDVVTDFDVTPGLEALGVVTDKGRTTTNHRRRYANEVEARTANIAANVAPALLRFKRTSFINEYDGPTGRVNEFPGIGGGREGAFTDAGITKVTQVVVGLEGDPPIRLVEEIVRTLPSDVEADVRDIAERAWAGAIEPLVYAAETPGAELEIKQGTLESAIGILRPHAGSKAFIAAIEEVAAEVPNARMPPEKLSKVDRLLRGDGPSAEAIVSSLDLEGFDGATIQALLVLAHRVREGEVDLGEAAVEQAEAGDPVPEQVGAWELTKNNQQFIVWANDGVDVPPRRVPRNSRVLLQVVKAASGWRLTYNWETSTGPKAKLIGSEDTREEAVERAVDLMERHPGDAEPTDADELEHDGVPIPEEFNGWTLEVNQLPERPSFRWGKEDIGKLILSPKDGEFSIQFNAGRSNNMGDGYTFEGAIALAKMLMDPLEFDEPVPGAGLELYLDRVIGLTAQGASNVAERFDNFREAHRAPRSTLEGISNVGGGSVDAIKDFAPGTVTETREFTVVADSEAGPSAFFLAVEGSTPTPNINERVLRTTAEALVVAGLRDTIRQPGPVDDGERVGRVPMEIEFTNGTVTNHDSDPKAELLVDRTLDMADEPDEEPTAGEPVSPVEAAPIDDAREAIEEGRQLEDDLNRANERQMENRINVLRRRTRNALEAITEADPDDVDEQDLEDLTSQLSRLQSAIERARRVPGLDEGEPEEPPEDFGRTVEGTFDEEVIEEGDLEEEVVDEPEPEPSPTEEPAPSPDEEPAFSRGEIETIVENATLGVDVSAAMRDGTVREIKLRPRDDSPVRFVTDPETITATSGDTPPEAIASAIERWEEFVSFDSLSETEVEDVNERREALSDQFGIDLPLIPEPEAGGFTADDIESIVERATAGALADVSLRPEIGSLRIRLERDPRSSVEFDEFIDDSAGTPSDPVEAITTALDNWEAAVDMDTVPTLDVRRGREAAEDEFGIDLPAVGVRERDEPEAPDEITIPEAPEEPAPPPAPDFDLTAPADVELIQAAFPRLRDSQGSFFAPHFDTLEDLLSTPVEDILAIRGVGQGTIEAMTDDRPVDPAKTIREQRDRPLGQRERGIRPDDNGGPDGLEWLVERINTGKRVGENSFLTEPVVELVFSERITDTVRDVVESNDIAPGGPGFFIQDPSFRQQMPAVAADLKSVQFLLQDQAFADLRSTGYDVQQIMNELSEAPVVALVAPRVRARVRFN